jgi:DNA-binding GntR family transcriptional regulator
MQATVDSPVTPHTPAAPFSASLTGGGMSESAYDAVLTLLIMRDIPPGGRISVDRVARDLGVSQTPLRQALKALEAEGLVTYTHLSGFRASELLTLREFDDLFVVRRLLEPEAAASAALARSDSDIGVMRDLHESMAGVLRDGQTLAYSAFALHDAALHDVIAAASGNGVLRQTMQKLHAHLHVFRLLYDASVTGEAIDEHEQVVSAIADGDAGKARTRMTQHLKRSQQRLQRGF